MKKILAVGLFVISCLTFSLALFNIDINATSIDDAKNSMNMIKNSADSGKDVPATVTVVINTMLYIVGILAVAMIIFSGIRYLTAHGDKSQVESAKNTLIYSVVGLVIAIIAYAIVNFVIGRFESAP